MSKCIKDFPSKISIADNDLLLIQDATDNAYKRCTKQQLLSESNSMTALDPILNMTDLSADWSAENVVVDVNNLISQINDTSGNNNHAVQNTISLQPILIHNCLNNSPTIKFSGRQYFLHPNLSEPKTIIAVIKNNDLGTNHRTLLGAMSNVSGDGLDAYYFKTNDPSNSLSFIRGGLSVSGGTKAILDFQKFYIQSVRLSDNMIEVFINSLLVDRQKFSGQAYPIVTSGSLGAGYYNRSIVDLFLGDVYRVCMFSQTLSYDNLFKAISYLKNTLDI